MASIPSLRLVIWLYQPEKGQPPEVVLILSEQLLAQSLSELTAPGAVVILSEQLLAQPLSELTAPGAVLILSEQLLAQPLSVLTAPRSGAHLVAAACAVAVGADCTGCGRGAAFARIRAAFGRFGDAAGGSGLVVVAASEG